MDLIRPQRQFHLVLLYVTIKENAPSGDDGANPARGHISCNEFFSNVQTPVDKGLFKNKHEASVQMKMPAKYNV